MNITASFNKSRLQGLLVSTALGIGLSAVPLTGHTMSSAQKTELNAVLNFIGEYFVDAKIAKDRDGLLRDFLGPRKIEDDFSDEEFADSANRMLSRLDPHSRYLSKSESADYNMQVQGNSVGIGVSIVMDKKAGSFEILDASPGSPAEKMGLKKGDILLRVTDKDRKLDLHLSGKNLKSSDVLDAINGPANTNVTFKLRRGDQELDVTLTRVQIEIETVTSTSDKKVGYIRLEEFKEKSAIQVAHAIRDIEKKGDAQSGYILDLRGNRGGLVLKGLEILSELMIRPAGNVITMKRQTASTVYEIEKAWDMLKGKKLNVLIDEDSASVSEMTAGALKDLGRATIYGSQSYGKGSVYGTLAMPSGNLVSVTLGLYYLPSGTTIQARGVVPDVLYVPGAQEMEKRQKAYDEFAKNYKKENPGKEVPREFNEAAHKNALLRSDPVHADAGQPSQTCVLTAARPDAATPDAFRTEKGELDGAKICAWEGLSGNRIYSRVSQYQGEPLRFMPR